MRMSPRVISSIAGALRNRPTNARTSCPAVSSNVLPLPAPSA